MRRAFEAVRIADVPRRLTLMQHVAAESDWRAAAARVRPRKACEDLIAVPLPRSLVDGLRKAAREAITRHGLHGWLSKEGRPQTSSYESLSLTYNPDLHDPAIHDVHQSTLGTSVNPKREQYYATVHRFKGLKNTYFDTYGFRRPTPAARIGALGTFLDECRLSLVRSRLSVLIGDDMDEITPEYGWHRDEPVFENLRINIPLVTHRNYRLQIEHRRNFPSPDSATSTLHYLKSGHAYTFDTNRPHRVFPVAPCRVMRVHLVLGFSPWLRYEAARDAWVPNEYYGRIHPFDIVRSGGLHPSLKAAGQARRAP